MSAQRESVWAESGWKVTLTHPMWPAIGEDAPEQRSVTLAWEVIKQFPEFSAFCGEESRALAHLFTGNSKAI